MQGRCKKLQILDFAPSMSTRLKRPNKSTDKGSSDSKKNAKMRLLNPDNVVSKNISPGAKKENPQVKKKKLSIIIKKRNVVRTNTEGEKIEYKSKSGAVTTKIIHDMDYSLRTGHGSGHKKNPNQKKYTVKQKSSAKKQTVTGKVKKSGNAKGPGENTLLDVQEPISGLLLFHISCIQEYTEMLRHYNILFYGYGNKITLLQRMFPRANIINKFPADIRSKRISIILNTDISELDKQFLPKNGIICALDTMDPIHINFTQSHLTSLNFIMKDLTTYERYFIDTVSDRDKNITNLLVNVSKRSKNLFKLFLENIEKNRILSNNLLKIARKQLLINNKKVIKQLLNEFIDHQIIKVVDDYYVLAGTKEKYLKFFESIYSD